MVSCPQPIRKRGFNLPPGVDCQRRARAFAFDRRPTTRGNRGRVPSGGAVGPWTPSKISGVAAVWLAEDIGTSGGSDGAAYSGNWTDRVNGYVLAPLGADMGVYRTTFFREGSQKACLEQSAKAGKSTDAGLVSIFNGTNKTYTVITVAQIKSNGTNCYWSAGSSSDANQFVTCQFAATGTMKNQMSTRFGATAATIDNASEIQAQAPQMIEWARTGSSWKFQKDGIQEASFTRSDTGVTVNQFLVGGSSLGAGTVASSTQYVSAVIVVAGAVSAGDLTLLRLWAADRLGMQWKKGLQGLWTGTSYVILGSGQSNALLESRGTAPYTALTAPRAYAFGHDLMLHTADDPEGVNTNNSYTSFAHAGTGSAGPPLCNALYTAGLYGANDALIVAAFSVGGTTSTSWAAGATTSPPQAGGLTGVNKLRLIELMRNLPNPKLVIHIIYQGESNSGSDANVAIWPTDWTTIADEINTWTTTTMGWTWLKTTTRHLVVELPDTNWSSATPARWAALKTNQLNWVAARSGGDAITVKAPSTHFVAADNLHLETDSQATLAGLESPAIMAAA